MEAEKKRFEEGREAIEEAVKFVEACLELGGIPHLRSKYAGLPLREQGRRGIMLVCYGRAEHLPSEIVLAPGSDPEWYEFVRTVEGYTGDYKVIEEKYGKLVSEKEVKEFLRELGLTEEEIEEIRRQPIYGRD